MEDLNCINLVGRLVRDAELKYSNSGTPIINLSIAVNRSKKQGNEWVDEVSFFDLVLFGKRGEALNQYLQKGTQIAISGSLQQERWNDKSSGDSKSRIIIIIENIQLLSKPSNSPGNTGGKFQPNTSPGNNFDSDIPF